MKTLFTILSIVFCNIITAQNLLPNPGFELYNSCPYWVAGSSGSLPDQIIYSPHYDSFPTATFWITPLVNNTPDYYNSCDTTGIFGHGTPNNSFGHQETHSGNGYGGIYMYLHRYGYYNNYREFLETKFNAGLVSGHQYHIHFYVSPAASNAPALFGRVHAVDKIGAYISDTMVLENLGYTNVSLVKPATIQSPAGVFITDTANWTKIEGNYTAHGGEQWVTLGRFSDGMPQRDTFLYSIHDSTYSNDSFIYCYMYIDDVCVMDITDNTTDTSFCADNFPVSLHGLDVPASYLWNTGDTTADLTVNTSGIYWRRATADCVYHMDTFRVKTKPPLSLGPDKVVCREPAFVINNNDLQLTRYLWNTGDTICCIPADTTGTYTLTAYNECGSTTDSINITVLWPCEHCILMPDAFTPNSDGYNDVFRSIARCPLQDYRLSIYNRWGQQLFTTTDVTSGWDGSYNNSPQDIGVYFYFVSYKTAIPGAATEIVKGDFTLVR